MLVLTIGESFHINNQRSVFSGIIDMIGETYGYSTVRSDNPRINGITIYCDNFVSYQIPFRSPEERSSKHFYLKCLDQCPRRTEECYGICRHIFSLEN